MRHFRRPRHKRLEMSVKIVKIKKKTRAKSAHEVEMENSTKVIIVLGLLLLLGLPILSHLGGQKTAPPAQPAQEAAPALTFPKYTPPQQEPEQQPVEQQAPIQQPRPQPKKQAGPPPPMDLSNTAWTISHPQAGNVTVQLFGNGTALAQSDRFPMQVEGTWRQNGNSLSLSSPMGNMSAQIQGDQLIAMGQNARRLR
jgi:hypothetical protein